MTVSEKIKTIDIEIKQNKAQYKFGRQEAKIWPLSFENVEFLTEEWFFIRKGTGRKSC